MIIAIVCVAIVLVAVLAFVIVKKKRKKTTKKLDDKISKLKKEQDALSQKEIEFDNDQKEKDAFSHIKLTDDIEEELGMKEESFVPNVDNELEIEQNKYGHFQKVPPRFGPPPPFRKTKRNTRDDDFEQFLNEHSYSRRIFDKTILDSIKDLSPKLKAIIIGNLFDKYDI